MNWKDFPYTRVVAKGRGRDIKVLGNDHVHMRQEQLEPVHEIDLPVLLVNSHFIASSEKLITHSKVYPFIKEDEGE